VNPCNFNPDDATGFVRIIHRIGIAALPETIWF
jgi:hypothetical protein